MNDNLEIIDKKNIVALIKELQYLNDDVLSKFNGESDKEGNLLEKLTYFNNNLIFFLNENKQLIKESNVAKQDLSILFQKLQDSKNIEIAVQKLKLDVVGKKEFDDLLQLVNDIKGFKNFISKKTIEINDAYIKLNRFWLEEDEVLKRIEKLEKSFLITVLFGGIGIGIFLTITTISVIRYFL
jgi:peroxiredoxin family protein